MSEFHALQAEWGALIAEGVHPRIANARMMAKVGRSS